MKKLKLILFSISILFFTEQSYSEEKVIYGWPRVIDGDSIVILKESIRLYGIDAPEIRQICRNKNNIPYMCGIIAKDALKNFIEIESRDLNKKKKFTVITLSVINIKELLVNAILEKIANLI